MALLDDIKLALKIDGNDANTEINDLITAAEDDLELSGITAALIVSTDPLIKRLITLYCKANYGYEDPVYAAKFLEAYQSLRNHLVMSGDYSAYDVAAGS